MTLLFEMFMGASKTLVSASVIKLFLCPATAKRVLFLVDRLELENLADSALLLTLLDRASECMRHE